MEDNLKFLNIDDTKYQTKLTTKFLKRNAYKPKNPKELKAFIPGLILKIFVKEGDKVEAGQSLFLLEAMKMKNTVEAEISGKIKKIYVEEGDKVAKNELLLEFE